MPVAGDDWRRMGQEDFLPPGTLLVFETYTAVVDAWEGERCLFCFAPFMSPEMMASHPRLERMRGLQTAGYTTTEAHREGAHSHWACAACVADFRDELGLRIAGGPLAPAG